MGNTCASPFTQLQEAVKKQDVRRVRQLLDLEEVDPNLRPGCCDGTDELLVDLALKRKPQCCGPPQRGKHWVRLIRLLLSYGANHRDLTAYPPDILNKLLIYSDQYTSKSVEREIAALKRRAIPRKRTSSDTEKLKLLVRISSPRPLPSPITRNHVRP